jgi:subtilisin family serine protease
MRVIVLAALAALATAAGLPVHGQKSPGGRGPGRPVGAFASLAPGLATLAKPERETYQNTDFVINWPLRATVDPRHQVLVAGKSEPPGVRLHRSEILVQLDPTKAEPSRIRQYVEQLKTKYHAEVVDAFPEIGVLLARLDPEVLLPPEALPPGVLERVRERDRLTTRRVAALDQVSTRLRREPWVRLAVPNTVLGTTYLPPASNGKGPDPLGILHEWDWRTGPNTPAADKRDGNWGLKYMNFPAAWNFRDAIRRRNAEQQNRAGPVKIGIVDTGFGDHEDLRIRASGITIGRAADHGSHVAGIIGARWNNQVGIDGCCPDADLIGATVPIIPFSRDVQSPRMSFPLTDIMGTVIKFIEEHPDVKVINLSLGYNWVSQEGINPNKVERIQKLVRDHGLVMSTVAQLAIERGIILVSAAGNDSDGLQEPIEAQWASPFNWAALNKGLSGGPARNVIVVESIGRDGKRSPFSNVRGCLSAPGELILSAVATAKNSYAAMSGTSMAAPHVTGLIGLMYSYNPGLKYDEVLKILDVWDRNRPAGTSPAPTINAFDGLVACRPKDALRDLADINGDGRVDMQDFKVFKADLEKFEGRAGRPPADANVFPRTDLNGSGRLSRDPKDKRSVLGRQMSDLDVMRKAWQDPKVPASKLEALLNEK